MTKQSSDTLTQNLDQLNNSDLLKKKLLYMSKMAMLGELAGGIAHEINNPVAIVIGKSDMMLNSVKNDKYDKEKFAKDLDRVAATGHRIGKLVATLRTFVRDDSTEPMALLSVQELIKDITDVLHTKIMKQNTNLTLSEDSSLKVLGRKGELSQIILALLVNGLDHNSDTAEKWMKVDWSIFDKWVEIRFTDSGPGIPENLQDKIFEPYFSTDPTFQKVGLGLSEAKRIAAKYSGELFLNRQSKNTEFVLRILKADS